MTKCFPVGAYRPVNLNLSSHPCNVGELVCELRFLSSAQTDPENTDYSMEHGATRNFQAEKLIEQEETKIQRDREEEELNNPMKVGLNTS